jgi:hypothetical protein
MAMAASPSAYEAAALLIAIWDRQRIDTSGTGQIIFRANTESHFRRLG